MFDTEAKTRFLHQPLVVFAVIFSCFVLIFSHLHYLNTKLIENSTVSSTRQYAEMLSSFFYTSEAIGQIMATGISAANPFSGFERGARSRLLKFSGHFLKQK